MKKTLRNTFLLILLGSSIKLIAQPTLTAIGCNPVIGYTSTSVSNAGFSPGNAGANQTWNLANIGNTANTSSQYIAVGTTTYAALYPNANIASNGASTYGYYNASSASYTLLGLVSPTGIVFTYSDGEDYLRFPFTFNDSYTDTWEATFFSGVQFFRKGTTTVTADGYGTLITPSGTFTNTLRIHFVQDYNDSSSALEQDYFNDSYIWYKDGVKEPLAFTNAIAVNGGAPALSGAYAAGTVSLKESENQLDITIYPNPTSNTLSLALNNDHIGYSSIKILNQLGQVVSEIENKTLLANEILTIDVANLSNGVYTLQMLSKISNVLNKKFTINK